MSRLTGPVKISRELNFVSRDLSILTEVVCGRRVDADLSTVGVACDQVGAAPLGHPRSVVPDGRSAVSQTTAWLEALDGTNAVAATIRYSLHGFARDVRAADAARIAFEDADPIRTPPSYPHRKSFEGRLWLASTRQHVLFESFWERAFLANLDRTLSAVRVASQPMWIDWSTPRRSHAPDFSSAEPTAPSCWSTCTRRTKPTHGSRLRRPVWSNLQCRRLTRASNSFSTRAIESAWSDIRRAMG